MTNLFETRVENLEPKEEKKIYLTAAKKSNGKSPPRSVNEQTPTQVL